jgi:hypothetical protein
MGYAENGIDQKKIDEAINKGVSFIQKRGIKSGFEMELEVLTLLHCGVDPLKDGALAQAINQILASNLKETYRVAVTAMALEMADRVKYQKRIAECAHALVNAQCKNGQWNYDSRYDVSYGRPIITNEPAVIMEDVPMPKEKPGDKKETLKKIQIKRTNSKRSDKGDNSTTQFALLGLRSAARSGVEIPLETWQDTINFLEKDQLDNGGWTYSGTLRSQDERRTAYGSMTCACICALAIAKFYSGQDIHSDPMIKKGLDWLGPRLIFQNNPGIASIAKEANFWFHYYYIYSIERVGAVMTTKEIGGQDWYAKGVEYLLKSQSKDGSWNTTNDDQSGCSVMVDTCFALLFLKKVTPTLTLKPKITGE